MRSDIHIAISTLAFLGKTPEEIIAIAKQQNYVLEFSSGMPYRKDMEALYLKAPVKKLPHNYFPAPEHPFVINLASTDKVIRERSVSHCINGLRLASLGGAPFFSAHAGFCIDPNPSELGKKLEQPQIADRNRNWSLFMESVRTVLREADKYNVDFLLENNVIAPMNLYADGTNPLFCCGDVEMNKMISEGSHPRLGILLDTGHLKVSSNTLKFSLAAALKNIKSSVKAIHHSDNDGIFDTNDPINGDYWFWTHIKDFAGVHHVLEVKKQTIEQVNHQLSLIRNKALQ